MSEEVDTSDVFRVMVATDNHLGYAEKDAVRGNDSFIAFEEMLEMAVTENVDFILLGGDLFHDAVPSQNAMHNCMKLLRRYTFGDKPISVEVLSDQAVNFHNAINETVNYEDPNLNISIPVFSIHGNHDDPSGFGRLSALDLLSTTGLVNYFGRWTDLTKVVINPILLRKGESLLALYGLSHIHDARLARLFENFKVTVECPSPEDGEWFHLMVLHQNHADRGPKNYIPEEILPDFLHLVIWGHEHDCLIEPQFNAKRNFYVTQPGSSVATSLAEGEAIKKHVGLLEVHKTRFQLKPLPLQTVRPFVFESVDLSQMVEELHLDEGDATNKVLKMAKKRVEAMIERAKEQLTGHPKQPTLPLIRLRIIFNAEEQMFNAIRFGQTFNDRVANPADVVHFKKMIKRLKHEDNDLDKEALQAALNKMDVNEVRIENFIESYFEETESHTLNILTPKVLSEITNRLVEKNDVNAAEEIIQICKQNAIAHLMETMPADEHVEDALDRFKEQLSHDDILKLLDNPGLKSSTSSATLAKSDSRQKPSSAAIVDSDDENAAILAAVTAADDNDGDSDFDIAGKKRATPTRGRKAAATANDSKATASGRGRGAAGKTRGAATGRGRGRGGRGGATRGMQQLDVSVNSNRSSLMDALMKGRSQRGAKKASVIDISDSDSDSD